jgi:hypothetical protein
MTTVKGKFQDLYEFIDRAVKSRKYPENTGMALKTALSLFGKELSDEEKLSIDEFKKNLEPIYQNVFTKNKNFSASSLATYKSRVMKVLGDYEKYGVDPTKMTNWSPKVIKRTSKKTGSGASGAQKDSLNTDDRAPISGGPHSFDFAGGVKLLIPKTAKFTDAIMDGALKETKVKLKEFSELHCDVERSGLVNENDVSYEAEGK